MPEKGRVSNRQAALFLTVTTVLSTAILFAPAITAAKAKQDGWMSLLVVATVYGLLVAWVVIRLSLRFPDKTLIEYAPLILGSFLGKILGLAYVFWFLHICAVVVREFGDFMLTAFMPETPLMAFNVVLLLLAAYAVRNGLEVICRVNEFVFPFFFLISIVAIFILTIPQGDFSNLLPVLEQGIKPVLSGALVPSAWRGQIFVLLMFLPYISAQHKTGRYLAGAVVFMGVVLALGTALTTAVMGELTQYLTFPFFTLSRNIEIGFIQRVEALVLIMWVAGVTVKAAVFYYCAVLGTAQLLNLRDYRPLVLPIGLIVAPLSLGLFGNTRELVVWLSTAYPPYAYTFQLVIPSLLLLLAILRKKRGIKNEG